MVPARGREAKTGPSGWASSASLDPGLQGGGLDAQLGEQFHQRANDQLAGRGGWCWRACVGGLVQMVQELACAVPAAVAVGLEPGGHAGFGQPCRVGLGREPTQERQADRDIEPGEQSDRIREVLLQDGEQLVMDRDAMGDQVAAGPDLHPQRDRGREVRLHRLPPAGVGPYRVGEHEGSSRSSLLPAVPYRARSERTCRGESTTTSNLSASSCSTIGPSPRSIATRRTANRRSVTVSVCNLEREGQWLAAAPVGLGHRRYRPHGAARTSRSQRTRA
jgi:hypothetical protein